MASNFKLAQKIEPSHAPSREYRIVQKMSGEQAFGKLADSSCALVKK